MREACKLPLEIGGGEEYFKDLPQTKESRSLPAVFMYSLAQKMFPYISTCKERPPKAVSKKDDKICQTSYTMRPPKALVITVDRLGL